MDFYDKYYWGIHKLVGDKVDNGQDADELTHEILVAGINSWPSFDGRCAEFTWLCSIAKHKIIDYYRKKKLKTVLFSASPIFEEIADKALGPEGASLKEELKSEVGATLAELKAGYQKILRLKYIEGFKIYEIAQKLAISVKAVESRLIRAKKQFRQAWSYERENKKDF